MKLLLNRKTHLGASLSKSGQIKSGKSWMGKDGIFTPLLQNLLNAALEGEMDAHLTEGERELGNRRNGRISKQLQTPIGEITINTPRDRDATFEPQIVQKRERILAEGLADRILPELQSWENRTLDSVYPIV